MKDLRHNKPHQNCLILNADYTPVAIIDWQRAMVWSYRIKKEQCESVEIIEYYSQDKIQTNSSLVALPAVMRITLYLNLHKKLVNFSRKNLFIRDDYSCQYCGRQHELSQLTYDHVIPKSKWSRQDMSPTNWYNIVTSCVVCNRHKGNKTLKQANMRLQKQPTRPISGPKYLHINTYLSIIPKSAIPNEWLAYVK